MNPFKIGDKVRSKITGREFVVHSWNNQHIFSLGALVGIHYLNLELVASAQVNMVQQQVANIKVQSLPKFKVGDRVIFTPSTVHRGRLTNFVGTVVSELNTIGMYGVDWDDIGHQSYPASYLTLLTEVPPTYIVKEKEGATCHCSFIGFGHDLGCAYVSSLTTKEEE